MMHPETAKTLVEQRREELIRHSAESRQNHEPGTSWLSHHLPRWQVSWTRMVLSPAGGPEATGSSDRPGRSGKRGSSLVVIISAYR
jgi:hypothetical protein